MVSRVSNRVKAAAVAALMCLTVAGAAVPVMYDRTIPVNAVSVKVGETLDVGDSYKSFFSEFKTDTFDELIITVKAPYTGNMSFGLGVSTDEDPYWLEYDGSGPEWVDTEGGDIEVPGTEVKMTKDKEVQIKIDMSDIKVNPKGKFEFRNYYSADWSSGKEKKVPIELISIEVGGGSSSAEDTTEKKPSGGSAETVKVGESLDVGDNYKSFFSEFKNAKTATEMIITVKAPYTGNLAFGLGVSTDEDPYWLEYDGSGPEWVDTEGGDIEVPGTEVKMTKDKEVEIKIDLSEIKLNPKGKFEFRNYYSADWSSGKEKKVPIELISIALSGGSAAEETTEVTTEPTTKPTTQPTTEPTTEATTEATTEPTTEATEPPTEATTVATEEPTEPTVEPSMYGDINLDKKVDIMDVIALNKFLLGSSELKAQASANADMNGDKKVQSDDALYILKLALEMMSASDFPVKE
jgi:hypothetical protein